MSGLAEVGPREGPRSKRAVIVAAAIDCFGRDGFEHTKWGAIAEQVGIGQTALYHYFESKAHCLLTILSLELMGSRERFARATAGIEDDVERLRAAVAGAYDVTPRESLSARILLSHMDLLITPRRSEREEVERKRARALVRAIEADWTALVEQGMASGAFARRDAQQTGQAVLALIVSVWRWYRPEGDQQLPDVSVFIAEACERIVRP